MGCFPGGASPYQVEELSGNAWEWTRSLYRDSPYRAGDGREDLAAEGAEGRVLRGGAFGNGVRNVRCACRHWGSPYYRSWYFGFRVVFAPPL